MRKNKFPEIVIPKIVTPTFYVGGIEPENPNDYSVWINECNSTVAVCVENKWHKCLLQIDTGYTEEQQKKMKEKELEKQTDLECKLLQYQDCLLMLKGLLDGLEEK